MPGRPIAAGRFAGRIGCRTAQVGNIIYYWPEVQKIKQFLKRARAFPRKFLIYKNFALVNRTNQEYMGADRWRRPPDEKTEIRAQGARTGRRRAVRHCRGGVQAVSGTPSRQVCRGGIQHSPTAPHAQSKHQAAGVGARFRQAVPPTPRPAQGSHSGRRSRSCWRARTRPSAPGLRWVRRRARCSGPARGS